MFSIYYNSRYKMLKFYQNKNLLKLLKDTVLLSFVLSKFNSQKILYKFRGCVKNYSILKINFILLYIFIFIRHFFQ